MVLKPVKLIMTYDIICPHSWVTYQVLQKKLPMWRTFRNVDVEYKPAMLPLVHRMAHGVKAAGLIASKKNYLLNELYEVCDQYDIKKGNYEMTFGKMNMRSISSLLLLMSFKRLLPEYYEKMMVAMWEEFWHRSGQVHRAAVFLRLGRELGIPFKIMDELVMNVEARENYVGLSLYDKFLIEDERIVAFPWFTLLDHTNSKILGFGEVFRLELLDEVMALSDVELEKLAPVPEEEVQPENDKESEMTCEVMEENHHETDKLESGIKFELYLKADRFE